MDTNDRNNAAGSEAQQVTGATTSLLQRIVKFYPAYDKRDAGYGIHCAELLMLIKGPEGAVQFKLATGWQLPHVVVELEGRGHLRGVDRPMPFDLGYHSPLPHYEGHEPMDGSCQWVDGKPCYYDGSTMNAEPVFDTLVREGSDAVWAVLEAYYQRVFGSNADKE